MSLSPPAESSARAIGGIEAGKSNASFELLSRGMAAIGAEVEIREAASPDANPMQTI